MASTPLPVPRSRMRSCGVRAAERLAQPVERQQTAARGAVMAGAEGERRLDLDADPVDRDAGAVVRAVDDETAGRDRLEPGEALAHPILRRDALETRAPCPLPARPPPRPALAPRFRPAGAAKMDRHAPVAAHPHRPKLTATSSAAKLSASKVRNPARRLFIGYQRRQRGCRSVRRTLGIHRRPFRSFADYPQARSQSVPTKCSDRDNR